MTVTMSKSTPAVYVRRGNTAPRVSLAARAIVDMQDMGLTSVDGAQKVIATIRARKAVTKLVLNHNSLGDYGCQELFHFLATEGGQYRIAEIGLVSNDIGDLGLEAIAEYLNVNQHLKILHLQNNVIVGDFALGVQFSTSLNSSVLEILSLAANRISDEFCLPFFSHLDSQHLQELHISGLQITHLSAPSMSDFLTSSRSGALETFKCNGTCLGRESVCGLLKSCRLSNFTLQKLEIYASDAMSLPNPGIEQTESAEEMRARWTYAMEEVRHALSRNDLLKRRVHHDALCLLSHSRPLLLSSAKRAQKQSEESAKSTQVTKSDQYRTPYTSGTLTNTNTNTPMKAPVTTPPTSPMKFFKFHALPIELQHHILSFLAPTLSALQRIRVFDYAASLETLKPLLSLPNPLSSHLGCIPDPAMLPFTSSKSASSLDPSNPFMPTSSSNLGSNSNLTISGGPPATPSTQRPGLDWVIRRNVGRTSSGPCSGGRCMGASGSVLCHRYEAKMQWLKEVGCARFEAEGRGEADVMRLLELAANEGRTTTH